MRLARLYLLKSKDRDVFVDTQETLPQHQIDGLRFLYKQFKKNKTGVILNDPPGYKKLVQISLFLNALRPLLDKPVFILCDESKVESWKDHLRKWTDFGDDVAVETSNALLKSPIFIKTPKDALLFCRRQWSIVIVHDNTSKEMLQTNFKADFKIWLTSVDMKKNLYKFSSIYTWIHPENKFNVEEFVANKDNRMDVLNKSLLLDAFMEGIVLRRSDFSSPKMETEIEETKKQLESPIKRRKNKDPTGTKVKRSKKRIIEDDDDDIPIANHVSNKISRTGTVHDDTGKQSVNTNDLFNFTKEKPTQNDIDAFIRDKKPMDSNRYREVMTDQYSSSQSDTKTSEDSNPIAFANAINDIVGYDNDMYDNKNLKFNDNKYIISVETQDDSNSSCYLANTEIIKTDDHDVPSSQGSDSILVNNMEI